MSIHTLPKRPTSIKSISPWRLRFSFNPEITPKDWIKDDLFMSHFLNAMSLTFPDGERFFMDAVRSFKHDIKDTDIQKDIQGFIAQEGLHGNAHESFNLFLKEQGYPTEKIISLVKYALKKVQDLCQEKEGLESIPLAFTCGLEHITAILGDLLLTNHELTNKMHDSVQPMWIWHAIEETEHKAVAYDVYATMYQNYPERTGTFLLASVVFILAIHAFQYALLAKDNKNDLQTWLVGLNRLYGINGYITSVIPMWLTYLKPGFHPWGDDYQDNTHLIGPWKNIVLDKTQDVKK
jgi:uncharacterized protein